MCDEIWSYAVGNNELLIKQGHRKMVEAYRKLDLEVKKAVKLNLYPHAPSTNVRSDKHPSQILSRPESPRIKAHYSDSPKKTARNTPRRIPLDGILLSDRTSKLRRTEENYLGLASVPSHSCKSRSNFRSGLTALLELWLSSIHWPSNCAFNGTTLTSFCW